MSRNVYLKTITRPQALQTIGSRVGNLLKKRVVSVPLTEALGLYTAEPVFAVVSNPNHNAAAMDGIAVIAQRTEGAHERNPVTLTLGEDYCWVNTGHVIHPPYDAVVMVEDVEAVVGEEQIEAQNHVVIRAGVHQWQHVRMVGEDIAIGDMLLTQDHKIRPVDLGALASAGVSTVCVYDPLVVAMLPTGSEIVNSIEEMKAGSILESNALMFSGMVQEAGAKGVRYPVIKDSKQALSAAILEAVKTADVVVVNAGSSAGSEDYTRAVLSEIGEVIFHGIDIKPGKPTLFAMVEGVPVFGIPGYPVSAFIAFDAVVMPLLQWQSQVQGEGQAKSEGKGQEQKLSEGGSGYTEFAILTRPIVSSLKHEEFVRVQMGTIGGRKVVTPVTRGAGATMSLVKANGMIRVPRASEGLEAGTLVAVKPLKNLDELPTLVAIGSHDLVLDVIANLAVHQYDLLSSHVGSLGGLMAIKRQEAHLAPVHLLDETTGTYNVPYIEKYFKGEAMVLIRGIRRTQGFYTRKGETPITDLATISALNLKFVNRQKGSGTRILLDYQLVQAGMSGRDLMGYDLEVLTHTAVAQAVLVGNADVGMGIASVASKMGLDFYPLLEEQYDFLLRKESLEDPIVKAFLETLQSEEFKRALEAMGGYRIDPFECLMIGGEA